MAIHLSPTDQPFVKVWLGAGPNKVDLNVIPNHLVSLSFVDNVGMGDEVSITLFDETFVDLETILLGTNSPIPPQYTESEFKKDNAEQVISFQYGWANGPKSPIHVARIVEYSPSFDFGRGLEITIRATSIPMSICLARRDKVWPKGTLMSNLVKFYAKEHGLDAYYAESKPLGEALHQKSQSDWSFLTKEVIKYFEPAESNDSYVVDLEQGKALRIVTPKDQKSKRHKNHEFTFGADQNGVVEAFSPVFNGNVMVALGAGGIRIESFDRKTKKPKTVTITEKDVKGRTVEGSKNVVKSVPTPRVVRGEFADPSIVKAYAKQKYNFYQNFVTHAEAVIHGDPTMSVHDRVTMNVRLPDGQLHYSSGTWQIDRLVHDLSADGAYTTTINMFRSGVPKEISDKQTTGAPAPTEPKEEPKTTGEGSPPETRNKQSKRLGDDPDRNTGRSGR